MAPSLKKTAAVTAAAPQDVLPESVEEPAVPRVAAIGDVLSMKGLLDDYALLLLEEKYGRPLHFVSERWLIFALQASNSTNDTRTCAYHSAPWPVTARPLRPMLPLSAHNPQQSHLSALMTH